MTSLTPGTNGRQQPYLRTLWQTLRRYPSLSVGIPLLVMAATLVFLAVATPIYEAATTIRIDEQRSDIGLLDALKTLASGGEVPTEMEVLQSRSVAEDVVDALALQLSVQEPTRTPRGQLLRNLAVSRESPEAEYHFERVGEGEFQVRAEYVRGRGPLPFLPFRARDARSLGRVRVGESVRVDGVQLELAPEAARHDDILVQVVSFQEAVKELRDVLAVRRPSREADIVEARYRSPDPVLVRDVANATAAHFIQRRQEVRKAEARSTVRFLNEQLDTLAAQLRSSEEVLRRFQEQNHLIAPQEEAIAQLKRLAETQAKRDLLNAERSALSSLLAEIEPQGPTAPGEPSAYRRLLAFPTILANQAAGELLRVLADVENERTALLSRRTVDDPDVRVLTTRIGELEDQLYSIAATYSDALTNQVSSLNSQLGASQAELEQIPAKEITFARLYREMEVLAEIFSLLQTRRKEAEIATAIEDVSVRVVDPAILPTRPVRPNVPLSLFLAVVLGVVLGFGSAFAREYMDSAIHTREDLQTETGLNVLGIIPRIPGVVPENGRLRPLRVPLHATNGNGSEPRLVTRADPTSPVSEAYRSLRTNITFATADQPARALVFTSAMPGDGKSTTATNFAITLAQQGLRVLLIDADMRRGYLHDLLKAPQSPGLSNVLVGSVAFPAAVKRVDLGDSGSVDFLAAGTYPPNPAELLGSARLRGLLESLESTYDAVILDAPPLNVVTDAAVMGTYADGVILVVRAGVTEGPTIGYAIQQLQNVRAPVLGAVLNDVDFKRQTHYGPRGAYAYYYSAEDRQRTR